MYWFNKASDLMGSAAALWVCRDPDLSQRVAIEADLGAGFSMGAATPPVYRMLCGMAVELVLKAIVVESGDTVNMNGHDLVDPWQQVSLPLSDQERRLLSVLSHDVVWAGRYPTPKKEVKFNEYLDTCDEALYDREPIAPDSSLSVMEPNHALDWTGFQSLWQRASNCYWQLRAQNQSV